MAIVWSQRIESNHYEVRSAGATLRLYRNGVNHSQWNPNRPLSGCIWDLLAIPALYRDAGRVDSVLVLGFGAGSVGRQLRELIAPSRIVGLDLDPIHLSIADGFFECAEGCDLIAADAVEWVQCGGDGSRFDVIIDDIYSEDSGIPFRCAPLDVSWFWQLTDLLNVSGILIMNLVEPDRVKHLAPLNDSKLKERYPYAIQIKMEGYENRIVAFSAESFDRTVLLEHLKRVTRRFPRCSGVSKRYQFQNLGLGVYP